MAISVANSTAIPAPQNCLPSLGGLSNDRVHEKKLVEAAGVEPASEIIDNKERLHAQSRSGDFALRAQNGQGARSASPWISFSLPGRSGENQPAVRRPFAAHRRSREERQLN